jgi:hypothetical protein
MTPAEPHAGSGCARPRERKTAEVELPRNAVALSRPEGDHCIRWKCGTAVLWRVTYGTLYDQEGRPYWPQVWGSSYDVCGPHWEQTRAFLQAGVPGLTVIQRPPQRNVRRKRQASSTPSRTAK